jgi:NAD(P)-dependent dehydrogenase (short-subunit alcohol dehydrogenase family)
VVPLANRRIAILGGSAGIGLATARMMADRGAELTLGGRDPRRLAHAASSLPTGAKPISVDATDPESLRNFFDTAGPIDDLIVTVTGRGGAGPVASLADQDLPAAFLQKPIAHLRAVAESLPHLAESGSVTLVSAGSAQSSLPGTAGLAALNGAIEAAVPVLARELGPRRVNAVSPGVIETGWWDSLPAADRQKKFQEFAQRAPVRRTGFAEDVASAIISLVENTFITGVVLSCDGGLRLT